MPVHIEPYNPEWSREFEHLRALYHHHLRDFPCDVQHVGSTAVTGLWAKPILDVDIIIEDKTLLGGITTRLEGLGYIANGEQGLPGRFAFRQMRDTVPFQTPHQRSFPHHLYVCYADCLALKNHLLFRDMLRSRSDVREQYSALKQALVKDSGMNREEYLKGKTEFILSVLSLAGLTETEMQVIRDANAAVFSSQKIPFFSREHWNKVWSFLRR
jgi:GrpB-like predicted nucleotidyltransferase (UPF0157 family)